MYPRECALGVGATRSRPFQGHFIVPTNAEGGEDVRGMLDALAPTSTSEVSCQSIGWLPTESSVQRQCDIQSPSWQEGLHLLNPDPGLKRPPRRLSHWHPHLRLRV